MSSPSSEGEPRWVASSLVLAIHGELLVEHGGSAGVRDKGLLESALGRPRNRHAYEPEASFFDLAACYAFGIARNHPFVDGNKRTALAICDVFLQLNGWELTAPEPETVVTFLDLAAGRLPEDELARWIEANATRLP